MHPSPSVRDRLREATGHHHERVDSLFGRLNLADDDDYRRFLIAHATALLPMEQWLDSRADAVVDDWPTRSRGAALRADLARVGISVPDGDPFSPPSSPASIGGILYVLEGSKMGGRLLARQVREGLPKQYLAAGGNGAAWKMLISRLDDIVVTGEDLGAATRSASLAFDRFMMAGVKALGSVGIG